jgi:hypothetical protein
MWTTWYFLALILAMLLPAGCTEHKSDDGLAPYRAQVLSKDGLGLSGIALTGLSFGGLTLSDLVINGLTLEGVTPSGLPLDGLQLNGLTLDRILQGPNLDSVKLKGLQLNGSVLSGLTVNGIFLTGAVLQKQDFAGVKVKKLSFDGSGINLLLSNEQRLSGTQLIGAVLVAILQGPRPIVYAFRINNAYIDSGNAAKDVWHYYVTVSSTLSPTPMSICLDENNQPTDFIPLPGMYWDPATGKRFDQANAITLACTGGAIEKCVHRGYRPWAFSTVCAGSGKDPSCWEVPLTDYLQACTRMMRADYCGNGTPHTVDGTLLDIYDYLQPPVRMREETWQLEARWIPDGAICLSKPRYPELWPGGCKATDSEQTLPLPVCNPYQAQSGLIVSTFDR